jgi:hypothetical protein
LPELGQRRARIPTSGRPDGGSPHSGQDRSPPGEVAATTRRSLLFAAAVLALAACGGDGKTTGQAVATTTITSTTLAFTTSATPASSATGASVRFRGMTLSVPDRWKVETNSDGATVANGQACFRSDLLNREVCPGFEVYGPDGIAHGYEDRPYRLDQPFHPGTDVSPCATAPMTAWRAATR